MYYLGIDGGGTKTVFQMTDALGNIYKRVEKGCSNPNDIGMGQAQTVLKAGIYEVTEGIPLDNIKMFAGLSGGGLSGKNKELFGSFFENFGFCKYANGSDIENLIGLVNYKKAVLVIMGTGFVVYGINAQNRKQVSGWGQFFDRGGSGYTIGRDGICAALEALDGSGEDTKLVGILEHGIGESVQKHLAEFYRGGKRYIAGFSKEVFEAAKVGDRVAVDILENNMKFAAQKIQATLRQLPIESEERIPVVFAGGICKQWDVVEPLLAEGLDMSSCFLEKIEREPVEGAIYLAMQL